MPPPFGRLPRELAEFTDKVGLIGIARPGIATWLDALPHSANSGDIYARG